MDKKKPIRHTVFCEHTILDRETGYAKIRDFIFYSAPTSPEMAASIAANLKRIGVSYRVAEQDGKGKIIDEWIRPGNWSPDDEQEGK